MSLALAVRKAALAPGKWVSFPSALWRRAKAAPSHDLRFADNKSLVDAVTGQNLVTFTRASSGPYVGSDGVIKTATTNEPRFDHNPTTGESLGLLVEEQRTNLLLQSEDFGTTWTTNNTTVSTNQITAPDGLSTADKIVEAATTTEHGIRQDTASQSAGTYTLSVFAKAGEQSFLQFVSTGVLGGFKANFDLSNGTIGAVDASLTARVVPYPNNWYRCIVTATSSTAGILRAQWNIVTSATAARVESYAGNITKGLFLWGSMIEAGAFPTSYIPTTTATVTRSADVASISGSNFSSWYRQDEGTVFAGFRQYSLAAVAGVTSADDSTISNRIQLRVNTLGAVASVVSSGGSVQANYSTSNTSQALQPYSAATSYKADDFSLCLNGGAVSTDSAGSIPTVNQLVIGNNVGANPLNGTIRRLTYWPQRLSNSILQAVTQ